MVPIIETKCNVKTNKFEYILKCKDNSYSFTRLTAIPKMFSDIINKKDTVFSAGVAKHAFQNMLNTVPISISNGIAKRLDDRADIKDMHWRKMLHHVSYPVLIYDDLSEKYIDTIFFDYTLYTSNEKRKSSYYKYGKIVILDDCILTVEIGQGEKYTKGSEKVLSQFIVYTVYDKQDANNYISTIFEEYYDTNFANNTKFNIPNVSRFINLDPNHVVHHSNIIYINTWNKSSYIQYIDSIKDMDNIFSVHIIDNNFETSISTDKLSVGDIELPEIFNNIESIVDYDELEKTQVYDLFGNKTTLGRFKEIIL